MLEMFLEYATPKTNVPGADDMPDAARYLRAFHKRTTLPAHLTPWMRRSRHGAAADMLASSMRFIVVSAAALFVAAAGCKRSGGEHDGDGSSHPSAASATSATSTTGDASSGGSSGFMIYGPGNCGGTVKFQLTVKGRGAFCTGPADCNGDWLTIQRADRTSVANVPHCSPSCSSCEPIGCVTMCDPPIRLPVAGATTTWDGLVLTRMQCQSKTTHGSLPCAEPSCAPPGRYVAHMCAFRDVGGHCGGHENQLCTDVEFNFPTDSTVKGVIVP